jgi:hypothetical protein
MPPVNNSTKVEAKEFFHTTLNIPLAEAGYYVIPPFLSLEILKQESAYDSENFIDGNLSKFAEVFGADLILFTTIHTWNKSGLASVVIVDVEYTIKDAITSEVLFNRRGNIKYDTRVSKGSSGSWIGAAISLTANAISTAATKYVSVARKCNDYSLAPLPKGKYHPNHNLDQEEYAGPAHFKANL